MRWPWRRRSLGPDLVVTTVWLDGELVSTHKLNILQGDSGYVFAIDDQPQVFESLEIALEELRQAQLNVIRVAHSNRVLWAAEIWRDDDVPEPHKVMGTDTALIERLRSGLHGNR